MQRCIVCKLDLEDSCLYKHRRRKSGLQSTCKQCAKISWPTTLKCSLCLDTFQIKHRNIRRRRSFQCPKCVSLARIERNKSRSKPSILTTKGYIYLRDTTEKHGYKLAHRKAIEESIGRALTKNEVVHHIDGDRTNNNIENLVLTDSSGHGKIHGSLERIGYFLIQTGKVSFDRKRSEYILNMEVVT